MSDIPLDHLPMRPSTVSLFHQRGFLTINEIEEAKSRGGISNLAEELQLSLTQTAALVRELNSASNSMKRQNITALSLLQARKKNVYNNFFQINRQYTWGRNQFG